MLPSISGEKLYHDKFNRNICNILSNINKNILFLLIFSTSNFFILGLLNMALMVTLLAEWIYPNPNHIEWYFIFGVGWGMCDAVWQCALNALYGVLFKERVEKFFEIFFRKFLKF